MYGSLMDDKRPPRVELFGFYYLGFTPEGIYKFPNAHHVGAYYRVSADAVLRWLEEYRIDPASVGRRTVELSRVSVDIQLEMDEMSTEEILARIAEAMAEYDEASDGRRPWSDGPIR